jgi:hypothetical protein
MVVHEPIHSWAQISTLFGICNPEQLSRERTNYLYADCKSADTASILQKSNYYLWVTVPKKCRLVPKI